MIKKEEKKEVKDSIKRYLEILVKWRLKMNASKCCDTVFSNVGPNHLFLGVTFDEHLTFKNHIGILKQRADKRLNIIKIICHRQRKPLKLFTML